jgi:two-component system cell cycle response regulator
MEKKSILIVEDNAFNMKLVRSLLKFGPYDILEAEDAETGLDLAQKHKPDLILMDIQLPGMDGLAATRIIKKDPDLKDIPVIALTGFAMEGDEQKARAAGCDGYIAKPIDTRSFLKSVSDFLKTDKDVRLASTGQSAHRSKILIVDDEPLNVKLLAGKLPQDEYEIIRAYGGEEALEKVTTEAPDLILLDIMMPDIDGYEVTRRVKNNPGTKHIPIILVTALDGKEDRVMGLETGAEEFLSKPVNTTELLARINSMLRLKQYHDQLTTRTQSEEQFAVPVNREEAPQEEKKLPNVLLVEDKEEDVRLIQGYLYGQPYQILVARNSEEALSLVHKEKIDLVLLDILLPDIDGYELYQRLKEMDEAKDIQIIFITALQDIESRIKGIELGADDFLVKPFDQRELRARMDILLKKLAYLNQLQSHYETALSSAINDGLTGLYNHAYFRRFLELELKRSIRQGYPVALTIFDIDDFKKCNDTFGHLAGDQILIELARLVKINIREVDLAARYGGEEFVTVLPYAQREGALKVAERIRSAVESHRFLEGASSSPDKVTLSIGVALCPEDATSPQDLIENADRMLYKAKKGGKNRVVMYEDIPQ